LVLLDGGDLGVDGGLGTEFAGLADCARVALERAEHEGIGGRLHISRFDSIGEGPASYKRSMPRRAGSYALVRDALLNALGGGARIADALSGSSIA
jgi:hypothetical protein